MREINDILQFRDDISPFLAHLTKAAGERTASQTLRAIIDQRTVNPGGLQVSDIRFGGDTRGMTGDDLRDFFCATCFTETPLDEIHCLLDVRYRQVNLEPYGLVFLKNRLALRSVSPVLYINNSEANQDDVAQLLFHLINVGEGRSVRKLLPLFSVFGQKFRPPGAGRQ